MNTEEHRIFFLLLQDSGLFTEHAKELLRVAVENGVVNDVDFVQLLNTLKMEKNMMAIIDQHVEDLLVQKKQ